MAEKDRIHLSAIVAAPIQKVWECWTQASHIIHWNFASPEWHCPNAVNEMRSGGQFSWRMEAKDGSFAFDFAGQYTRVIQMEKIEAVLEDGRNWWIEFEMQDDQTIVRESLEIEDLNTKDQQEAGWNAILQNFKAYAEHSSA